jgi:tetratricopeptide (TPR) repeat protein
MIDSARIDELKRRVQLDPASIAFAALAEEYRRRGEYEEAITVCEAGLQRHPAYLSARVTLGRALLELGRLDEAREQLEQVLKAAPENLAAIRALADIHERGGEYPEPPPRPAPQSERQPLAAPAAAAPARLSPVPLKAPSPPLAAPVQSATPLQPLLSREPAPPPRAPHPDEAALPSLEAFLAAIRAAKSAPRQPE